MDENFAPYAPTKAVVAAIDRYRERGLPLPLDASGLEQIGIAGTMTPRTLQTLKFLKLINDDGSLAENFKRLKRASTEEYPGLLAEIVRAAYLPVFSIVNPAEDSDTALADAFRRYEPSNQRVKMISLFRGLCMAANIIPSKPRQRGGGRTAQPRPRPKPSNGQAKGSEDGSTPPPPPPDAMDLRLITAIIQQLPREPHWTAERRDKWLQTMASAVDLLFEVKGGHAEEVTR
jgi:hypothetical protein